MASEKRVAKKAAKPWKPGVARDRPEKATGAGKAVKAKGRAKTKGAGKKPTVARKKAERKRDNRCDTDHDK